MRPVKFGFASLLVVVGALVVASCASDGSATTAPGKRAIAVASETSVTTIAGATVASPPAVLLTDANGRPVVGAPVHFAVSRDGGSVLEVNALTDKQGHAVIGNNWAAPSLRGSYTVVASSSVVPGEAVAFQLLVTAGPAAAIAPELGNFQQAIAGHDLADLISVRVEDMYGNAVSDVRVEFEVLPGSGSLERSTATTDVNGIAAAGRWTLGIQAGRQHVNARVGNVATALTAFACAEICVPSSIAFVREGDIYVIRADGSRETVVASGGKDTSPAWSPDGQRIAFVHRSGSELWTMSADGSSKVKLAGPDNFASPAWSPDGTQIAVRRGRDVLVFNTADATKAPVLIYSGTPGIVSWSPDGRIVVVDVGRVYLVDQFGSRSSMLTPFLVGEAKWSPDGSRIAITGDDCDFAIPCHQWVAFSDARGKFGTPQPVNAHELSWSPDAREIAISYFVDQENLIASMSPSGTPPFRVVAHGSSPSWRPITVDAPASRDSQKP